jgi:hypothetical protein
MTRHLGPLENIPSVGERPGVEEAMQMVSCAVRAMEPDGQLAERWDEFSGKVLSWAEREQELESPQHLHGLRMMMEQMCGDTEVGEILVAVTKLGISAVLTAVPNIYCIVLKDRDEMHDDLAPLVEKGINLLHRANQTEPFDPVVRVDYQINETLEQRKEEHLERMKTEAKKDWVSQLIENAVRAPGAQN